MPVDPVVVAFDDASATNISLSLGSVDVATGFTVAACFKQASTFTSFDTLLSVANSAPTGCVTMFLSGASLLTGGTDDAFSWSSASLSAVVSGEWYIGVFGKAAGSSDPTFSLYRFSNTTWEHGAHGTLRPDTTRTADTTRLGQYAPDSDRFEGWMACAAIWGDNLSDGNRETMAVDLDAWLALSPQAMWVANGSTAIVDEVGSADETARGAGVTADAGQTSPLTWSETTEIVRLVPRRGGIGRW